MKKIKCKCGCGMERERFDQRGRERKFINGHQGKYIRSKLKEVWNSGKKDIYSKETLQKMRDKKVGGKLSKEHKENIGVANMKNTLKETYKRKQARWKSKELPKNKSCDICNSVNNLQKHHWNYNKPLLVNTLCSTCHSIQHISSNKFRRKYQ